MKKLEQLKQVIETEIRSKFFYHKKEMPTANLLGHLAAMIDHSAVSMKMARNAFGSFGIALGQVQFKDDASGNSKRVSRRTTRLYFISQSDKERLPEMLDALSYEHISKTADGLANSNEESKKAIAGALVDNEEFGTMEEALAFVQVHCDRLLASGKQIGLFQRPDDNGDSPE